MSRINQAITLVVLSMIGSIIIALLAAIYLLKEEVTVSKEIKEEIPVCEEAVELPYVGIRGFIYCISTDMVWDFIREEWSEPGRFERRRIDEYRERQDI